MVLAYADTPRQLTLVPDLKPTILVLQPDGSLNEMNSPAFRQALEQTLEHVTETVMVDFLWVDAIDAHGIAALVAGLQCATALGKVLSFQSMNADSHQALENAWAQQQEHEAGAWTHTFSSDLDVFLDNFKH